MIDEKEIDKEFSDTLQNYLIEADSDYIGLWEIVGEISRIIGVNDRNLSAEDSNKLLQALLGFIILMLHNGFEAVDLVKGGNCTAWVDQTPQGVSTRITTAWKAVASSPAPIGFTIWFNKIHKNSRLPRSHGPEKT